MSSSRVIRTVRLADEPAHLDRWPQTGPPFTPDFAPPVAAAAPVLRFPRNWTELEALVEERLRTFEARHRRELDARYEEGVQEGMRRREQEIQRKLEAAARPLSNLAQAVQAELEAQRAALYRQVTDLTAALAEVWLGQMVSLNEGAFLAAVRDALDPLKHMDDIEVHLNPADFETLRAGISAGDPEYLCFEPLRVVPDPAVAAGGAVARSRGGSVDSRLETRRERALAVLAPAAHDL